MVRSSAAAALGQAARHGATARWWQQFGLLVHHARELADHGWRTNRRSICDCERKW